MIEFLMLVSFFASAYAFLFLNVAAIRGSSFILSDLVIMSGIVGLIGATALYLAQSIFGI